jgi:HK97 family phage portal protein
MRLLVLENTRAAANRAARVPVAASPITTRGSGWFGLLSTIREPYTGAWQENQEIRADSVLSYFAVYACISLIATDIAKLGLRLVQIDSDGIWTPVEVPAFSSVLRKPNRFQNRIKFIEQWLTSKLIQGNTYVLKQRNDRNTIGALYVLDPTRVTPLVTPDGAVYYELKRDDLSGVPESTIRPGGIVVPASEIIHDSMVCLFHPLIGTTPIYACGLAARQGLQIQASSENFFSQGAQPGGVLTAPGEIGDDVAKRLKEEWITNFTGANAGKVAVLGDGLHYEPLSMSAVDAETIKQLEWTAKTVCACYHVPNYKIQVSDPPSVSANVEAYNQMYYSDCLQQLIENLELCLDEGLELPKPYGTEFDLDDLLRMDTSTRAKVAADGVGAGVLSPNDARHRYFNLGPVTGGHTPYLQQQNFSLEALSKRDALDNPFGTPQPIAAAEDDPSFVSRLASIVHEKSIAVGLYAS